MGNNEIKAREFLDYVVEHEKELKYSLAKNITFNKDIFEDVFSETILKVYNSILKNGTDVSDFKNYFFTSLKWTYVYRDNKNKKHKNQSVRDWFENNDIIEEDTNEEERFENTTNTLQSLKDKVTEKFGSWYCTVYFTYYNLKVTEGCSYGKLSTKLGIPTKQISTIIRTVRDYINTDEEIIEIKRKFTENAYNQ